LKLCTRVDATTRSFLRSFRSFRPHAVKLAFVYTAAVPTLIEILELAATGLAAGALGGLLGIGGSVIMIPAMTLLLKTDQHLAQATAMIVNIFVSLPAAYRHHIAKVVRFDVMKRILPVAVAMILVGVVLSNLFPSAGLKKVFGMFLIYVVVTTAWRAAQRKAEPTREQERSGWLPCAFVGGITGLTAGVLGIGGGLILVPLMQRVCRLPLRQSIATSSALMCITAIFGAILKNATLAEHADAFGNALQWTDSFVYAALLVPTAMIGAYLGAGLTHRLPLVWVRLAFILLMSWAALEMLGIL
jgi:uncharacterized membrane protein YfcA